MCVHIVPCAAAATLHATCTRPQVLSIRGKEGGEAIDGRLKPLNAGPADLPPGAEPAAAAAPVASSDGAAAAAGSTPRSSFAFPAPRGTAAKAQKGAASAVAVAVSCGSVRADMLACRCTDACSHAPWFLQALEQQLCPQPALGVRGMLAVPLLAQAVQAALLMPARCRELLGPASLASAMSL